MYLIKSYSFCHGDFKFSCDAILTWNILLKIIKGTNKEQSHSELKFQHTNS